MTAMVQIRKMLTIQKLSLFISCIALVFSIIAFAIANQANYGKMEYEINRGFKPIGHVPDVEIIKADGSVEKLNAIKSHDKLNDLMNDAQTSKPVKQQNNGIGINNDLVRQTNKIDGISGTAVNNKNITDKIVSIKEAQKVRKNPQDKTSAPVVKDINRQTNNVIMPTARQNINPSKRANATTEKKIDSKEPTTQPNLIKGIVIQIGSFKEKPAAEKQCTKMSGKLNGKECKIGTFGSLFGSLIVPFRDINEAKAFDKNVLNKQNIYGYIKNIG